MEQMPGQPPMGPGSGACPPPTPQTAYAIKARPRWRALRTAAGMYKSSLWFVFVLAVIAAIVTTLVGHSVSVFGSYGLLFGVGIGVIELFLASIVFLRLYAQAELLLLWITIEENTRKF